MRISELYKIYKKANGVSIDSRSLEKGDMFFALKGPNFDGHEYITSALKDGASFAIAEDPAFSHLDNVFIVKNTVEALQSLAKYHRCMLKIPVVGITGSNGKTTTKELITSVLKMKFNVFATRGNYNNHLGVPLSILSIKDVHEIAVIEMGANHKGEIKFLSEISMPTHGLITNIGKAHLEGFGGLEGVRIGKTELYNYLRTTEGIIFYNINDEKLKQSLPSEIKNINYSIEDVSIVTKYPYVEFKYENTLIRSNLSGTYNTINMVAAITVGEYFGLSMEDLKRGIESYIPSNNRSQIKETKKNTLIMDAYNANPSSMLESIKYFNAHPSSKKTLIIGHMLELGDSSTQEHIDLVNYISSFEWENVFLVGAEFVNLGSSIPFEIFKSTLELSHKLKEINLKGQTILLKGSRGIALEKCVEFL